MLIWQFHHIVRSVLASNGYPAPEAMEDFTVSRHLQVRLSAPYT